MQFLLTRPMRDVTMPAAHDWNATMVSTHTPHAGRDKQREVAEEIGMEFLLTRPMRDVTLFHPHNHLDFWRFYSHAPCGT